MTQITKDFPGARVLFDVDFSLERGEVHALVGQNGAGKSTLIKILGGVYADYGGSISLDGRKPSLHDPRQSLREGIASIYQDFTLIPHLTVAHNVVLGREPGGRLPGFIDHRQVLELAKREASRLGLDLPLEATVRQLGVAGQQLVEIVKAISRHARILVMDEPTARLSGAEREQLFLIMRDLAASGVGLIFISHFLEEIFQVADRVTVLRDGRVIEVSSVSSLDLPQVTRLVAGERYREASSTRAEVRQSGPPALVLEEFGVLGRVDPVNLSIQRGEVLGLAGLVGSGRSSLARGLVGAERKAFGEARTRRRSERPRNPAQASDAGILLLSEDRKRQGLILQRTVEENIVLTALRRLLTRWGVVKSQSAAALARSLIDRLDILPPEPSAVVGRLSGGNQQKVVFARAIAAGAEVLILDQPTAGVDVGAKTDLYEQITQLARKGVAIVLISDDLDELLLLSDRIMVIRRGRVNAPVSADEYNRASLLRAITQGTGREQPTGAEYTPPGPHYGG